MPTLTFSTGSNILRSDHLNLFQVPGIICIRPLAPVGETASISQPLSQSMTAMTNSGSYCAERDSETITSATRSVSSSSDFVILGRMEA